MGSRARDGRGLSSLPSAAVARAAAYDCSRHDVRHLDPPSRARGRPRSHDPRLRGLRVVGRRDDSRCLRCILHSPRRDGDRGRGARTVVAGEPAVDEIEAQNNKLKDAYGTIGETGDDSAGALQETVGERAYDEFETAIAQLPTDLPPEELSVEYREQTASLQKSLGEVQSEAGC